MRKSKAFLALALTLSLGTSVLAGCAPKKQEVPTPTPTAPAAELKPEAGATLKFWCDDENYNQKIIELFNKKYPDVKVTAEKVGTTDSRSKLELAGPTGEGADVLVMAHDGVAISAQAGNILELSELSSDIKNRFLDNAAAAAQYNGKTYGQPMSIKTIALFYNKKLVSEPVKTFEDLLTFAKGYNDPSKNKFAMYWQVNDPYHNFWTFSAQGYQMFGAQHNDKTKLGWDTPEALKGLEYYKSLKDIYPVASADATWDAMTNAFGDGKAPYALTGPWSIKGYKDKGVDFGVIPLPTVNGKHPTTLSTVDVAVVSSYTKYPQAAKLFAQVVGSDEGLKLYYDTKGELPSTKDAQNLDYIKADSHMAGVLAQAQYSMPMPYIPEMANVWDPYTKMLTAVWDGVQSPADALKAAQDAFNTSLTQKK